MLAILTVRLAFVPATRLAVPPTSSPLQRRETGGRPRMLGSLLDMLGGGDAAMVEPSKALPGRQQKMAIPDRHYVLGNKMNEVPEGHKVAVFANGCFWGSEKGIWRLPGDGIYSTAVQPHTTTHARSACSLTAATACCACRRSATVRATRPTRRTRKRAPA